MSVTTTYNFGCWCMPVVYQISTCICTVESVVGLCWMLGLQMGDAAVEGWRLAGTWTLLAGVGAAWQNGCTGTFGISLQPICAGAHHHAVAAYLRAH